MYENVVGDEVVNNWHFDESLRQRGVSSDRHREQNTPIYYDDAYYNERPPQQVPPQQPRKVTVRHILSRPKSSLEPRRRLPQQPPRLERHLSHPNLRPRSMTAMTQQRRQLPRTPPQPPGTTIIVIENRLPEQSPPFNSRPHSRIRRANSLPRPGGFTAAAATPNMRPGIGRRLPRTPHQSSLALHHTPASTHVPPRKRELPAVPPMVKGASINFPRLSRSPSREIESSLPLPSVPHALRTTFYTNRRKLLE